MLLDRRELLTRAGAGLGLLGFSALLADEARGAEIAGPLAPKQPHFGPKAKRVIHFFCNGGPSHVDTFDPKPALAKHAGQPLPQTLLTERKTGAAFPSPFKFHRYGESGLEISELFPHTAKHADDLCVLRALYTDTAAHSSGCLQLNTGSPLTGKPSLGAWLSYGMGSLN